MAATDVCINAQKATGGATTKAAGQIVGLTTKLLVSTSK